MTVSPRKWIKKMKIQGFQKLTLLDFPGKTAATVFTGGCNFRCPFCHNSDLVLNAAEAPEIPQDDILSQLERRAGFIDGVCITGGEPLLWQDISEFITRIKALGLEVKLDTNGSLPIRLNELLLSGKVDYVAMDIKNSPDRYAETVGLSDYCTDSVEKSVELLKNSGVQHEFRTTVVKELHDEQDMEKIGMWLGDERYFLQQYKLSDGVIDKSLTPYDEAEMKKLLETVRKFTPRAELRGI